MKFSSRDYALALFESVTENRADTKGIVARFMDKLRADRNSRLLPLILNEMQSIEAESDNALLVTVTSSHELTETQRRDIKSTLKETMQDIEKVVLTEIIDPALLGGIKLQIGDTVIDNTIQTKLTALASKF